VMAEGEELGGESVSARAGACIGAEG
jgi:hypothetical protein